MPKDDLISKLGSRNSTDAANKTATTSQNTTTTASTTTAGDLDGANRGTNMLGTSTTKSETSASVQTSTENKETNAASSKVEPSGSTNTNADPNEWNLENALKEIKKLREENKTSRLKYSESVDKLKTDADARITAREQELQELVVKASELEQIKLKEEDRKRDLSEKLAHREARIAELQAKMDAEKKNAESELVKYKAQVEQFKAESEAQQEVYKQRLNSELSSVPEKYRDIANYIVKGAGDPRDAVLALNEAKLRGVFDDKTVVVSHNVPGAADGARSTNERLAGAAQEARDKLSSMQKIKEGLKEVRSGAGNSAFRIR